MWKLSEKEFEESKYRLVKSILNDRTKAFENGKKVAYADIRSRTVEISRHTRTKHYMFPICYLLGHKIDVLTRFCSRCNIGEEKLMK